MEEVHHVLGRFPPVCKTTLSTYLHPIEVPGGKEKSESVDSTKDHEDFVDGHFRFVPYVSPHTRP